MRRMTSNNTTHTIRVPFKHCNKVQIRYRNKTFSLGMEWPLKHGDNPNIVINISDTANMDPPAEDVTIHQIDDNDPVEPIRSFIATTLFNTPLISPHPHDDVTSTTNNSQMIATQIQMANGFPLHNPSVCPSHMLANQNFVSNQPIVLDPGNPNADAMFFASRSFTRLQNPEPAAPMGNPTMGQPIVCQCPRPEHSHETNCSTVRSKVIHQDPNGSRIFNRQMNFAPPQMPLPPLSTLLHGGKPTSTPSTQMNNVGFSPAPLIRPSRPVFTSQTLMPRAPGDVNSAYYGQTLQTSTIPPHVSNAPMLSIKRSPVEDAATRPAKMPKKRAAKTKSPRGASPNAINHDQSLPSLPPVGTPEPGGHQMPASTAKANSPVMNNATPTTPIRPSIRLVPEESSSPETADKEPVKTSPAAVSTPTDQRVRSPVRLDEIFGVDEHLNENSEMSQRGVDHIIEQVARNGENVNTIAALPKTNSRQKSFQRATGPAKKPERKPPVEGRRRPGRPPKNQQIVLAASAAMPPVTGNVVDSLPHPYSMLNPNVCNNNLERIPPSCTELVHFDELLTAEYSQAVASLPGTVDPGNTLFWDVNCFQHFDDSYSLSTPGGPMSVFSSADPYLALSSVPPQSATPLHIYTHPYQNDSMPVLSNGAQSQEDQVSSSVITPPSSHNSTSVGETFLLTK